MRAGGSLGWAAITLGGCGLFSAPAKVDPNDCSKAPGCMVEIPGGTVLMGAQATDPAAPRYDPQARPDEGPVHSITVDTFWVQENEIRLGDWDWCVHQGKCTLSAPGAPTPGMGALKDVAGGLTWNEASGYCASLGARLPTEAEWEFLARSGDDRRFPWGDTPPCALGTPDDPFQNLPRSAWSTIPGCTAESVSPRDGGKYLVQNLAWGHWEWVADWYDADAYSKSASNNPKGPATGTRRVQRGGSWAAELPEDHRNTARMSMLPDTRVFDVGARCVF